MDRLVLLKAESDGYFQEILNGLRNKDKFVFSEECRILLDAYFKKLNEINIYINSKPYLNL